jgi:DNA-binding protein YbaB
MFDKFKQAKNLLKLRGEAKKLQEELEQIKHTEEDGDMSVTVNGAQAIVNMRVGGEDQEQLVKLINRAMKEVQKKSAKKMMEMGGGLSGLLGGMGQ